MLIIIALENVYSEPVASYFDDILISVNDPYEMPQTLNSLFQCMSQTGLRFSLPKVEIQEEQLILLRCEISKDGISLSPKTITAIQHFQIQEPPKYCNILLPLMEVATAKTMRNRIIHYIN